MKTTTGRILCGVASFLTLFAAAGEAAKAEDLTVDEIVRKANHMASYQGRDAKGRVRMVITDKQGRTREREFNMLRRDDGKGDENQKSFVYFHAPADVRKMVYVVHKHAALEKDDDRWLYMPALDLVKRIASSDKRTSFVGSDFLYEDISGRSPAEDFHELIETTRDHFVIKNMPRKPREVEFEYYIAHVDRQSFTPVKMEYFKSGNKLYRIIEALKIEQIQAREDGVAVLYPTVTESVARDLEYGSHTVMTFSNIRYNIGLDEEIFTERYLRRPPRDAMR